MAAPFPAAGTVAALDYYRTMLLIRGFEERCHALSARGLIGGSIHLCIGQEAIPTGACALLGAGDYVVGTYRGHGWAIARGADPRRLLAEMLGRRTGVCKGKGGSMHLTDVARGLLPPNGIVGGGLPIAAGAALGQQLRGDGRVTVCSFGEGTINQGAAQETLNLAAVWALPLVFVCENNHYAEMTPAYDMIRAPSFAARGAAYGLPAAQVDGMDPAAVAAAVAGAVARARAGEGPTFVEAETYRYCGHYQGDTGTGAYRTAEEVERWRARDPIAAQRARLVAQSTAEETLRAVEREVAALLDGCERYALDSALPEAAEALEDVYATPGL